MFKFHCKAFLKRAKGILSFRQTDTQLLPVLFADHAHIAAVRPIGHYIEAAQARQGPVHAFVNSFSKKLAFRAYNN